LAVRRLLLAGWHVQLAALAARHVVPTAEKLIWHG
jgi:hypothetical protein